MKDLPLAVSYLELIGVKGCLIKMKTSYCRLIYSLALSLSPGPERSSAMCSFAVEEVMQYYINKNQDVCAMLLDPRKPLVRCSTLNYLGYYNWVCVHLWPSFWPHCIYSSQMSNSMA